MKAILEFDLDDPDDNLAHQRCVKATDMAIVLWEFNSNSRKTIESMLNDKNSYDAVDLVFKVFRNLLDEQNVNIDSLIR